MQAEQTIATEPVNPLFTDPTAGMELGTTDQIALEAPRYIFTALDNVDPARKDQLEYLRRGGEETGNVCLRRSTNQFLPRCAITPLEMWGAELPLSLFPSEGMDTRSPLRLKETFKPMTPGEQPGRQLLTAPLYFYPMYPGEMILDAIGFTTGERKGIIELTALRGVDWDTGDAQRLQEAIFPADWVLPIELRLVEEQIQRAYTANLDPDLRTTCTEMLAGCEQSRRWATHHISKMNTQLDQRIAHQHVYSYSEKVLLLMAQLEMKPRHTGQEVMSAEVMKAIAGSGITPDMFAQMQERDAKLVTTLGEVMAKALADAFAGLNDKTAKPSKG